MGDALLDYTKTFSILYFSFVRVIKHQYQIKVTFRISFKVKIVTIFVAAAVVVVCSVQIKYVLP